MPEQIRPAGTEGDRTAKRAAPIVETGRVRRAGSRRQAIVAVFVVLAIGGLIAAGYFLFLPKDRALVLNDYETAVATVQTLQDTVELSGVVTARNNATVTSPEQGFVDTLLVSEGDWVNTGDLVAIINAEALEDSLVALRRSLERDQREYERFLLQHEYDLRGYNRERQHLVDDLEEAREDLAAERELFELGSSTASAVRSAEEAVQDLQDALDDHDSSVEEAIALHGLSVQNYEDDITSAREEIADIEDRLADTRITAPIPGRVVSISNAASTSGELLSQYATILEISTTTDPLIQSEIEEQYIALIEVGQPVAVEVSGVRYIASIDRIGQIATSPSDGGTPTVEIDVVIPDVGELIPGSSALLEVLVGEVPDAVVLPRGPYLTSGNRRYLFVVDGDTAKRIEVEYGEITDDKVQIASGINAGDRVITSSYQTFIDQTEIRLGEQR
jgi:multidrug efflux pump subunit AcrA (membrane-fusion protein)